MRETPNIRLDCKWSRRNATRGAWARRSPTCIHPAAQPGQHKFQGRFMNNFLHKLWSDEQGQDVAEYSVMLAVILVIVVGTIRLIGSNASNVFSNVGSSIQ